MYPGASADRCHRGMGAECHTRATIVIIIYTWNSNLVANMNETWKTYMHCPHTREYVNRMR